MNASRDNKNAVKYKGAAHCRIRDRVFRTALLFIVALVWIASLSLQCCTSCHQRVIRSTIPEVRSVGSRRKNDTVEAPHRSLTFSMQAICSKLGIQLLKTRHLYFGNVTSHVTIPPAPVALTTRLSRLMCSNVFHLSHKLMFTCPCCVSDGVYEDSTMACIRADALSGLSLRKFFKRQLLFSRSAQMANGFPKFPQNDFNANH
jgi:hypothetical protein